MSDADEMDPVAYPAEKTRMDFPTIQEYRVWKATQEVTKAREPALINTAWLLAFMQAKTKLMVDICAQKNADYAGATTDPFGNFKNVAHLGIATVEQGLLARITDKVSRAAALTKPGAKAKVTSESVQDTLLDLANYALLLAAYLQSKEEQP